MKYARYSDDSTDRITEAVLHEIYELTGARGLPTLRNRPLAVRRKVLPALTAALEQPIDLDFRTAICETIAVTLKSGIAIPLAQIEAMLPEIDDIYIVERACRIAVAIEQGVSAKDKDSLEDLGRIVLDRRYGLVRIMLAEALGKFKSRRDDAVRILLRALELDDDQVTPSVISSLGRLKAVEAADLIRPYLTHPYADVEARKALRKMGVAFENPAPVGVKLTRKRLEHTTSIGCDSEQLPTVLAILQRHASGLSERELTAIVQAYEETEPEGSRKFEFLLAYEDEEIRVRLHLVDGDELHIYSDSQGFIDAVEADIERAFP